MADLVGVFREPEFSPGRVDDDAAILEATAAALGERGLEVELGTPAVLAHAAPRAVLAMCQSAAALRTLDAWVARVPVINNPAAIRHCFRRETVPRLAAAGVPVPRTELVATTDRAAAHRWPAGAWVKRGDVHAMVAGDVVHADDPGAVRRALAALAARGLTHATLQAHVPGPVLKFYALADGRFFRCYGDGPVPPASIDALWSVARTGAAALGLEVFGGDLVALPDGGAVVIDLNDWPSFARCRDEAAAAIAAYVCDRLSAGAARPAAPAPAREA